MPSSRWALFLILLFASFLPAQCAKDNREDKKSGILITDFTITGTQTISATDLARITSDLIGSCYNDDSDEIGERIRASFQQRGYFQVEVKSVKFKPGDPLGVPKPVTVESEVSEGPQFRLGQVTFLKNRVFSAEKLRQQFPLKTNDIVEREKVASGMESLRKLYATRGYLDFIAIPETTFGSNATMNLNITVEEGPQYHMGKLDIVAEKEPAAKLRTEWKLPEGAVYDATYIDKYLTAARDILPANFSKGNVQTTQNCPDALIQVRLLVDPAQDMSHAEGKDVPCEEKKSETSSK
jgi:outer membrane protein assembly factor BamA